MREEILKNQLKSADVKCVSESSYGSLYFRVVFREGPRQRIPVNIRISDHCTTGSYEGRRKFHFDFRSLEEAARELMWWNSEESTRHQRGEEEKKNKRQEYYRKEQRIVNQISKKIATFLKKQGMSKKESSALVCGKQKEIHHAVRFLGMKMGQSGEKLFRSVILRVFPDIEI